MDKLAWLTRLIAFDTTSRNTNLPLIECVNAWCEQYGLTTRLTFDETKTKANLFATLSGKQDNQQGGLILSGHTDVVPVDGQAWDSPPFEATKRDGRIYGRGACDMKGFLAVVLALIPEWAKHPPKSPIHLAFSYDEEVGCAGAPHLIADLQKGGIQPSACLVGEPTDMRMVVAHKGIQVYRCRLRGHAAHSSLTPKGCNAIDYAAQLIATIRSLATELKVHGPQDQHFDVPFTTVSTNSISGGSAHNIIPAHCEFIFEFRHLPQVSANTIIDQITAHAKTVILPQMQAEHAGAQIEIERIAAAPGFEALESSTWTQNVRALIQQQETNKVAYATEAGLFQQANIPTLVCGPGSIEQAHRANEFVTIEQLEKCEGFLRQVVRLG